MLHVLKTYHWQTHSYAEHMATDRIHGELSALTDKFVEAWMGRRDFRLPAAMTLRVQCYASPAAFLAQMRRYRVGLERLRLEPELANVRDELVAALDTLFYLSRLR